MKRRTILTLSFILFLSFGHSYAQSEYGIAGGLNYSQFYNFSKLPDTYQTSYSAQPSYTFAGFYREAINSGQSLGAELEYKDVKTTLDAISTVDKNAYAHNIDYSLSYLYVYLTYQKVFGQTNHAKWSLNAAPYFGYLLLSKATGTDQYLSQQASPKNESPTHDIGKNNMGIRAGIALQFPISKKLDIRIANNYNIGLYDVLVIKHENYTPLLDINLTLALVLKDAYNYLRLYRDVK